MKQKKYLPMHLFSMLKELAFIGKKVLKIVYPDGYNSLEILYEGSKTIPRKKKKLIRRLIANERES